MKALYRKYRPCKLSEVVGQEQVTRVLSNSLAAGKISHAYLFIGPRGTGKTSVARIFAHEINKFSYEIEDDYVDIVEIDGASNRGIDNIRELREKAIVAPTSGKYKVYIIDEVHMLTKEAFNALLKTLEEPPEHVIFIMATTDAYKVPVTITSRAQTYTFKLADAETMFKYLKTVAEKEGIKINDAALKIIVKRGGGSFRDSLSLLDQISTLSDLEITAELVTSAMGLPEEEKIKELLSVYSSGNVSEITQVFRELIGDGTKATTLAEEMISYIIAEPKTEFLPLLSKLTEIKEPFAEARLLVALTSGGESGKFVAVSSRDSDKQISSSSGSPTLSSQSNANTLKGAEQSTAAEPKHPQEEVNIAPTKQSPEIKAPEPTEKSAGTSMSGENFSWEGLLEKVRSVSEVVYSQLKKCNYELNGNELGIYPRTKIVQNILNSPNNKSALVGVVSGGVKITIYDPSERGRIIENDAAISKISAIMGGEVQNDEGGNPF